MRASGKRRKKPPARPALFSPRRIVVVCLALAVFAAGLILNTEALIALPFACAAGACGHTAQWIVRACGLLLLATLLIAFIRRGRGARTGRASGRRGARKVARKPAAARKSTPRQSAGSG